MGATASISASTVEERLAQWKPQVLFTDESFLTDSTSIGPLAIDGRPLTWMRVGDMCSRLNRPEPYQPCDILEGSLRDCYVVAALSSICLAPELLHQFVVAIYEIERGAIFRLWMDGDYRVIAVDDHVPCSLTQGKDAEPQVMFARSRSGNAWVCLAEKAFAKVYGSYAAIVGGNISEAYRDLTGEIVLDFKLSDMKLDEKNSLLSRIKIGMARGSILVGCAAVTKNDSPQQPSLHADESNVRGRGKGDNSAIEEANLIQNHAYAVLDHGLSADGVDYLLIRNPWGNNPLLNSTQRGAEQLRSRKVAELDCGCAWVAWDVFLRLFNRAYVCHLTSLQRRRVSEVAAESTPASNLTSLVLPTMSIAVASCWKPIDSVKLGNSSSSDSNSSSYKSFLAAGVSGGASHYPTWRLNPLFRLSISESGHDESGDRRAGAHSSAGVSRYRIRICLSWKDRRRDRPLAATGMNTDTDGAEAVHETILSQLGDISYPPIGLTICADDPTLEQRIVQSSYWNKRDVAVEFVLNKGPSSTSSDGDSSILETTCIVVPSTYDPGECGDFFLSATVEDCIDDETSVVLDPSNFRLEPLDCQSSARLTTCWPQYACAVSVSSTWTSKHSSAIGPFIGKGSAVGRLGANRPFSANNPCWRLRLKAAEDPHNATTIRRVETVNVKILVLLYHRPRQQQDAAAAQGSDTRAHQAAATADGGGGGGKHAKPTKTNKGSHATSGATKKSNSSPALLKTGTYFLTPTALCSLAVNNGECSNDEMIGKFVFTNSALTYRREALQMISPTSEIAAAPTVSAPTTATPAAPTAPLTPTDSLPSNTSTSNSVERKPPISELIVMPSTWDAGEEGDFELVVFSNTEITLKEVIKPNKDSLQEMFPDAMATVQQRASGALSGPSAGIGVGKGKGSKKSSKDAAGSMAPRSMVVARNRVNEMAALYSDLEHM